MLLKFEIDAKEREIEIKKISIKEIQQEIKPEIEDRLKDLQKEKSENLDKATSLTDILTSFDVSRLGDFVMGNISYVQSKLEKHTNLTRAELDELSPAETIYLVKAILRISFGEDVGKFLNGFKGLFLDLVIPVMKQMI